MAELKEFVAFLDEANGSRDENARDAAEQLEALMGKVISVLPSAEITEAMEDEMESQGLSL